MSPRRRRRRVSRLGLLLFGVLCVGGLCELAVRGSDMASGRGFLSSHRNLLGRSRRPQRPFRQFGPDFYARGAGTGGEDGVLFITSTHGERFPLQKPAGTYRVVVCGGSTTYNEHAWTSEGIHYPLVLQGLLRESTGRQDIEVINAGFSAYSSAHSLVVLALDVLSWDPDLVILSHNSNDLSASYWPDPRPDYGHKYSHPFYMGADLAELYSLPNIVFQHLESYWVLRETLEGVFGDGPGSAMQRGAYPEQPEPATVAIFERNLRSFVALARSRGIDALLGTQAMHSSVALYEKHMVYKPYNDIVVYPSHPVSVARHRAFNRELERVAQDTGAWFVDNDAVLGDVDAYFTDHVHYTPEGVRVLAGLYAACILERAPALR